MLLPSMQVSTINGQCVSLYLHLDTDTNYQYLLILYTVSVLNNYFNFIILVF